MELHTKYLIVATIFILLGFMAGVKQPVACPGSNHTVEVVEVERTLYKQNNYCSHEMIVQGCYEMIQDADTLKRMMEME